VTYADGSTARVGDLVAIGGKDRGVVLSVFTPATRHDVRNDPYPSVPSTGLFVNTDSCGLVHYVTVEDVQEANMRLIKRAESLRPE
jgi:hypothetical protein